MMDSVEKSQNGPTFLTVALVAEFLGVTTRTVRRYIESGIAGPAGTRVKLCARLAANGSSQEYQIEQSSLDEFIKQRTQSVRERSTDQQIPAIQVPVNEEHDRLHTHLQRTLSTMEQQAVQIASQAEAIERLAAEKSQLEVENMRLRQQLAAGQQGWIVRVWRGLFGWRPALPVS